MGNIAHCYFIGTWFSGVVVIALKYIALCALLLLSGCFKSVLPSYLYHSSSGVHKKHHTSSYKVRSGDTLYQIGQRFGIKYKELARRNHLSYPYTIYKGQRLYLSGIAPRSRKLPVATRSLHHKKTLKHVKRRVAKKHISKHVKKHVRKSRSVKSKAFSRRAKVGPLRWPVVGVLTSPFGRRGSRMHDGIDIGVKEGTAVHAAAAGEVVYSNHRLSGYGNLIIIRHSHDLFTAYAHNQRNLVRKGDVVKVGDIVARVGHTGHATGPHLHFEVRRGEVPVDPLVYLPKKKRKR